MAFFQITYLYSESDGSWTEVFFDEASSLDTFLGPTPQELQALVDFRGTGTQLVSSTVTEEGGLRRSKIFPTNYPANHGSGLGPKDVSGVKAKIRLNFSGGGGRIWNVGGIADVDVVAQSSAASVPSGFLATRLTDAINFVKATNNPYLGKRLKSKTLVPWKNVVSIAADPANAQWTQVTISSVAPPVTVGTEIYFQHVDKLVIPWLRGIYRTVGVTDATHFSIPTLYRMQSPSTSLRNVQWREAQYDYPPIVTGAFSRFGTRDTRGPFGRRRGRRSSVKAR